MAKIKEHVHAPPRKPFIRTLGARLAVAVLFASIPLAALTVFALADIRSATELDARDAVLRLGRAMREVGDPGDITRAAAALPQGSVWTVADAEGRITDRYPDREDWVGGTVTEDALRQAIIDREEGVTEIVGNDGVERLYAFAPTGSGTAILGLPSDVALAHSRAVAFRTSVVSVIVFILTFLLSLALADLIILRRIHRLAGAMRHIASGDIDAKNEIGAGLGDLDEIAQYFGVAAARAKAAREKTEQMMKQQTATFAVKQGLTELEKARLEALLSSIGEGVVFVEPEGRITYVNKAAEHALGFTSKEAVGTTLFSIYRLEDDKQNLVPSEKRPASIAMRTGQRYESPVHPKPYYFVRKDKSRFPVQMVAAPVILDGQTLGAITVFLDITNEVEFDQRKSEFISIASHQLRSPLAGTKWLADMLRKGDVGKLTPKQQDLADRLFEANERMVVMVNDLLNVSRIESGSIKPTPAMMDMHKLTDGVVADTAALVQEKKQKFIYDRKQLPQVYADALLAREVFMNFVTNAIKYTPEGGNVTVVVEGRESDVHVAVSDTGIGIPKKDHGQLFKKFFRAENATKSTIQGTGLGLYVCKSIVELSGGKIWFESEENKGTTFHFTLPLSPSGAAAAPAPAQPA